MLLYPTLSEWTQLISYLVESVVVDSDVIELGTLLNVFQVSL